MLETLDLTPWALVFLRVAALALLLPNVAQMFPVRWRLAAALVVTLLIAPVLAARTEFNALAASSGELALEQIFWGVFLGGTMRLFLGSFAVAGSWIHQLSGWGTNDPGPDGTEVAPALTQFHAWLGGMAFLAMGGPVMTIDAIWNSFVAVPLSSGIGDFHVLMDALGTALAQSLWLSLRIGSPVLASLLISTLAVGVIQRAIPHVQLVRISMAGNWLVLLVAMAMTVGLNLDYWQQNIASVMRSLPSTAQRIQNAEREESPNRPGSTRHEQQRGSETPREHRRAPGVNA